jgi:alanyl-tRNA synthetase
VRRVEAVTGLNALRYAQEADARVQTIAAQLKTQPVEAIERVAGLLETLRSLEKELARAKSRLAASQGDDLAAQAVEVNGVKVLAAALEGADAPALRDTLDKLKDKLKSAVVVLGSAREGKVSLIAGVTADLTGRYKAGELVNFVAQQVGGKGGGRADMAQAGGTEPARLSEALGSVRGWVAERQSC